MQQFISSPFTQIALPIIITIILASWINARSLDGFKIALETVGKRIDDVAARLGRIEDRLTGIETRLSGVERKVDALEVKAWR